MALYAQLLGKAFAQLPNSLQKLHALKPGQHRFHGHAQIARGRTWLTRLLSFAAQLPPAGNLPIELTIQVQNAHEIWRRRFGRHIMQSRLSVRHGALHEKLGLARLQFQLQHTADKLSWRALRISALGIPLPLNWFIFDIFEFETENRYSFNVRVELKNHGLLIHYCGWLQ